MGRLEQRLQMTVASYLRVALRPPTVWTAFPAGGGGKTRGAILKGMGLKAGWPDILIMHPAKAHTLVLGVELKSAKGSLSKEQKSLREAFLAIGGAYVVCRSLEDVQSALEACHIPTFAALGGLRRAP